MAAASVAIRNVRIKAGKRLYQRIMDGGFTLDQVTTVFAPAAGPRFLVTSGFDIPLIREQRLGAKKIVWLVGASSGAWRMAAWRQPEPEKAYARLIEAYIDVTYTRCDTPQSTATSLRNVLDAFIEDDAIPFALRSNAFRLGIIVARTRSVAGGENPLIQWLVLLSCFLANRWKSSVAAFFERVVFHTGAMPPPFCWDKRYEGAFFKLSRENFKPVLLASAAIPLVVPPVRDIHGAPKGLYVDGGLTDYNIAQNYATADDDVVLFFNHQERIIPTWMDKRLKDRRPEAHHIENLLLVFPSREFIHSLPDRRVPDRDDFVRYANDNSQRKDKWRAAVRLSATLGEDFLEVVDSGKIRNMLEKL